MSAPQLWKARALEAGDNIPKVQQGLRGGRHFDAAALIDAAEGCKRHLDGGGKMTITLAG